jgi:parallel beta-helix repeat protein
MMKTRVLPLLSCLCAAAGAAPTADVQKAGAPPRPARGGTAYFVSPEGNDSGAGTERAPFLTIHKAASRAKAGDVVTVRPGKYAGFGLGWDGKKQSGTAAAPIVFHGESGATIESANPDTGRDGINLEGASYVVIQGFTVDNAAGSIKRAGIRAAQNNHVVIRNNRTTGCGSWGIFASHSDDVLIENNTSAQNNANPDNNWNHHGIYVSNSAQRPVIRGNTVYGNWGNGIHVNGDASQGGSGVVAGALIEKNKVYDNGKNGGSAINCDGIQGSTIRNNLLYANLAKGISLYRVDAGDGAKNNLLVNNTVVMARNGPGLRVRGGSTGNVIFNNVFFTPGGVAVSFSQDSLAGTRSDYNLVGGSFEVDDTVLKLDKWRAAQKQETHSVALTDLAAVFVNPSGGDYRLLAKSPALRAGATPPAPGEAPKDDIEGTARPAGGALDAGAFQSSSARRD